MHELKHEALDRESTKLLQRLLWMLRAALYINGDCYENNIFYLYIHLLKP